MTTDFNCLQTYASLNIAGSNLSPILLTQALGIEPTFQVNVGDIFPKGTKPRVQGIWAISTEDKLSSLKAEDHIVALLDRLPSSFRSLVPVGCSCKIQCYWQSAVGHGGPELSAGVLARMAEHGIDLDFDFYSDV